MSYETERDADKPWGYWLRGVSAGAVLSTLVDEDGTCWASVREAFWCGSLKMPGRRSGVFDREVERLFGVLTAVDRRSPSQREMAVDMFEGDSDFYGFYMRWMQGAGLLDPAVHIFDATLTAKGRAVLLMLAATRPHQLWAVAAGPDSVAALTSVRPISADRERWFAETATLAAKMQFRFNRDFIYGRNVIVLTGDALGDRMPLGRTLWSQMFDDAEVRDRYHHWLCIRLDRWAAWGEMAYRQGAAHLTHHLLTLLAIELSRGEDVVSSVPAIGNDWASDVY